MKIDIESAPVPALEWAIAKIEGFDMFAATLKSKDGPDFYVPPFIDPSGVFKPRYTSHPSRMLDLLDQGNFSIERADEGGWQCETCHDDFPVVAYGETPELAVARCFLAVKCGEYIDVPSECVQ